MEGLGDFLQASEALLEGFWPVVAESLIFFVFLGFSRLFSTNFIDFSGPGARSGGLWSLLEAS